MRPAMTWSNPRRSESNVRSRMPADHLPRHRTCRGLGHGESDRSRSLATNSHRHGQGGTTSREDPPRPAGLLEIPRETQDHEATCAVGSDQPPITARPAPPSSRRNHGPRAADAERTSTGPELGESADLDRVQPREPELPGPLHRIEAVALRETRTSAWRTTGRRIVAAPTLSAKS